MVKHGCAASADLSSLFVDGNKLIVTLVNAIELFFHDLNQTMSEPQADQQAGQQEVDYKRYIHDAIYETLLGENRQDANKMKKSLTKFDEQLYKEMLWSKLMTATKNNNKDEVMRLRSLEINNKLMVTMLPDLMESSTKNKMRDMMILFRLLGAYQDLQGEDLCIMLNRRACCHVLPLCVCCEEIGEWVKANRREPRVDFDAILLRAAKDGFIEVAKRARLHGARNLCEAADTARAAGHESVAKAIESWMS